LLRRFKLFLSFQLLLADAKTSADEGVMKFYDKLVSKAIKLFFFSDPAAK
jgi:hypothetical protein